MIRCSRWMWWSKILERYAQESLVMITIKITPHPQAPSPCDTFQTQCKYGSCPLRHYFCKDRHYTIKTHCWSSAHVPFNHSMTPIWITFHTIQRLLTNCTNLFTQDDHKPILLIALTKHTSVRIGVWLNHWNPSDGCLISILSLMWEQQPYVSYLSCSQVNS